MNTHRQDSQTGGRGQGASRRVISVGLPDPHAGVVDALRSSFHVGRQDMPADMIALLRKLDRF